MKSHCNKRTFFMNFTDRSGIRVDSQITCMLRLLKDSIYLGPPFRVITINVIEILFCFITFFVETKRK